MAPSNGSRKKPVANKAVNTNSKNKISKRSKPAPPVQQKTKSKTGSVKKKRKVYTVEELGIPKLNTIVPVGVDQPKGKKKGKIFVDDQESMMAILAIVNAGKEGQIESKMMKSRHMEEIREARQKEAEAKQEQRKSKLDETKDSLRRKRKRKPEVDLYGVSAKHQESQQATKANRKRVSFA